MDILTWKGESPVGEVAATGADSCELDNGSSTHLLAVDCLPVVKAMAACDSYWHWIIILKFCY
jgi:hypothetical protein